jgi:anti-sigma B factor antagonist
MARKAKKEAIKFSIEGEMTIFRAQELREAILPIITTSDEVEIDLSTVTEVDASGMQLMISVKLESILRGKTLRYVGHSKAVLEMLDLCDLGSFFGDQVVIGSKVAAH